MAEPKTRTRRTYWLWVLLALAGFALGIAGYEAVAQKISLNSPVTYPMDI